MTSVGEGTIPLWFDVPEQFREIDLAEEPEVRAERTAAQLAETMPFTTGEQRLHFLLVQQLMIDRMADEGVVYAATLLAHSEGDTPRLTTAQFTVTVRAVESIGPDTLPTIAERLRREDLRRDVAFVGLPAGLALTVVEDRELTLPATVLGDPGEHTHLIRQLQCTLPFPTGTRAAIFTISTECLEDWDDYVDILGGILRTVTLTPPGRRTPEAATPSIRSVLDRESGNGTAGTPGGVTRGTFGGLRD